MRVLHIYKTYFPDSFGGVEQVIAQLSQATNKLDVQSRLLTLSKTPSQSQVGHLDVIRAPLHVNVASCPMGMGFKRFWREQLAWADVLHFHFPWPFAELYYVLSHTNKPAIVSYHADIVKQKWLKKFYQPIFNRFMKKAKHVVAASPNYLASSQALQMLKNKVSVIPYGFSLPSVSATSDLNPPKLPGKFILFIGVLRYYKGLHILLDAIAGTELQVVVLGDGPMKESLCQQAEKLNITAQLHFLGEIDDASKWSVIQKSTAVVLPSHLRAEAFGMSLLEGLMFKKPLISTELGSGTSFVNEHEQTGFVVPPGNVAMLQQAMLRLWSDADLAKSMGEKGYQRYLDYFNAQTMANAYHELYQHCLAQHADNKHVFQSYTSKTK